MAGSIFSAKLDQTGKIESGQNTCDNISNCHWQTKSNFLTQNERRYDEHIKTSWNQCNQIDSFFCPLFRHQINSNCSKCENSDGLVAPCKISPEDIKSFCIHFCKNKDQNDRNKNSQCHKYTIFSGFLINVQVICNHQTAGTKGCISGCDWKNNHTEDCDDSSHRTKQTFCNFANCCGGSGSSWRSCKVP